MSWPAGCLRSSCSDSLDVLNEPKNWQRLMPAMSSLNGPTMRSRSTGLSLSTCTTVAPWSAQGLGRDGADPDPGEVGHLHALEREPARRRWIAARVAHRRRAVSGPDLVEHGHGVLAHVGSRLRPGDRRLRRPHERPGAPQRPAARQPHVVPVAACVELLEVHHVGGRVHRGQRDAPLDAALEQLPLAVRQRERGDGGPHLVEREREQVGRGQHAGLVGGPVLGCGPLRRDRAALDHPRDEPRQGARRRDEAHLAVGAGVHERRDERAELQLGAPPLDVRALDGVGDHGVQARPEHRRLHRHVD